MKTLITNFFFFIFLFCQSVYERQTPWLHANRLAAIESIKPLTGVNDHWISVAVEVVGEDRGDEWSAIKDEWTDLGLKRRRTRMVEESSNFGSLRTM